VRKTTRHAAKAAVLECGRLAWAGVMVAVATGMTIAAIALDAAARLNVSRILEGFGPSTALILGSPGPEGMSWSAGQIAEVRAAFANAAMVGTYKMEKQVPVRAANGHALQTTLYAVDSTTGEIMGLGVVQGQSISEDDQRNAAQVCLLGLTPSQRLFGNSPPVGETLVIGHSPFRIKGLLRPLGPTELGVDRDDFVWVPLSTGLARLGLDNHMTAVRVKVHDIRDVGSVVSNVTDALCRSANLGAGDRSRPRVLFPRQAAERFLATTRTTRRTAMLLAGGLVLGSAVVLAAALLARIRARRREIGLKRALGATARAVASQFALEALLMTTLGVGVGVGLGTGIVYVAPVSLVGVAPHISLLSIVLGAAPTTCAALVATVLASSAAARLAPAAALRDT